MKSILVIGMGRFGRHLAKTLLNLGNDVVVIDKEEDKIQSLTSFFTDSYVGDCTKGDVVKSLGVKDFDLCFVCIERNFESSLVVTSTLKDNNAQKIISLAQRDKQADILKKIGADEVIYAARVMAEKTALKYNADNIVDLIQLSDDYAIFEIPVFSSWLGKSIMEIDVRKNHNVNIIAVKNGEKITVPSASYIFSDGDNIMVLGEQDNVFKLANKK